MPSNGSCLTTGASPGLAAGANCARQMPPASRQTPNAKVALTSVLMEGNKCFIRIGFFRTAGTGMQYSWKLYQTCGRTPYCYRLAPRLYRRVLTYRLRDGALALRAGTDGL